MPDIVTFGETMAVMVPTEKGALRYAHSLRLRMAGAESNTAIAISKLGHSAGWVSALGNDPLGEYVLSSIRGEGVDVSSVKIDDKHRTGLMIKELGHRDTSVYYYRDGSAASHFSENDLNLDYLKDARIIHLTGITPLLSNGCKMTCQTLLEYAKKNRKILSFDPNIRLKLWGDKDFGEMIRAFTFNADIVFIGLDEAKFLFGTNDVSQIVELLREKGVRYIAIKDGSRGAWCADRMETVHIPPEPCVSVDPIGAGDGFNGAFLCGVLEGRSLYECGKMGAIAGAMATETTGDVEGYPTEKQMSARLESKNKIYR
ncbi:MAG: sugar kinase [Clostridia bacterium]|nr:sugar kinase [Clostridia bacterium]